MVVISSADVSCIMFGTIPGVGEGGNFVGDCLTTCGPNVESDAPADGTCDLVLQSCETPNAELTEASKGLGLVPIGVGLIGGSSNSASKIVKSGNVHNGGPMRGLDQIKCIISDSNQ